MLYQGPGGSSAYDAMGNIVFYQYRVNSQRLDQYTVTYLKKEGYLESATSGINVSNLPDVRPATDESYYNVRGERIAIAQHTEYANGTVADTVRAFAYDGNGQIISRRDGTANGSTIDQGSTPALKNQHYVYVNGQQVAHYDESTTVDVLSQVTAFSNSNGTGDYVVQQGDTLKSIAQAVYGNASLWYVVAQANALNGDADLAVGLSLSIPAVTTSKNDSTTFKPYNPSEIQGSTTPNLPVIAPPPPPPKQHCNVIAAIVVIAVVVVASILTAGAALAAAGATLGETFAVGATALAGGAGFTAATVGAAALGGFVGNVAGQVAGDALGVHQGFSFGEALTGGLTAGATAGLGGYLQGTATFGEVAANGLPALNTAGKVALAAGSYAAQNASAEIAGQDHHFSWAGVVASAASAFVPSELQLPSEQDALSAIGSGAGTSFLGTLANGVVEGGVQREVSRALGDDHTSSWKSIGENALGTALAQAGVSAVEEQNNPSATGHSGYSFDFTKGGQGVVSGDALAGYQSSDYPSLASSDMYSTYAGAYGTGSASQPTVSTSYGKDNGPGEAWGGPGYSVDAQYPSGAPLYDLGVGEIPVQAPYLAPSLTNEPEITSSPDLAPTALDASRGLARFSSWADREGGISTLPVRADLAPKVASLPDVDALYDIQPGWFAQSHAIAEAEKNNPNNSAVQQGVYTVLDGLAMPLFLAEEAVRVTGNAPAQAGVSAQWAARASLENNTDDSLTDISNSLYTGGTSLLGLAGGAGVVESATADTVLGAKFVGFSGEGAQLSGATGNYTLRSPFYLDATPGQLNSGIPLGVRNPLVPAENRLVNEVQLSDIDEPSASVQTTDAGSSDVPNRVPVPGDSDFIGPLEKPTNWDDLTLHPDAHAFSVHGGDVTGEDLIVRARTGIKPNGDAGPIPPLSSAFYSDDLLISTDQAIRDSGGLQNAIARQPGETVVRVEAQDVGDLGSDLGYGYQRLGATGNKLINGTTEGPLLRIDGFRSAQGIYEFNATTGRWETITVYPAPTPH